MDGNQTIEIERIDGEHYQQWRDRGKQMDQSCSTEIPNTIPI